MIVSSTDSFFIDLAAASAKPAIPAITPDPLSKSAPPLRPLDAPTSSTLRDSFERRQGRGVFAASASESDGDSHWFEAVPAPARQNRREDLVPPIPAPRQPNVSPPYDTRAPLRPEPVRPAATPARHAEERRRSLRATYSDSEPDHARYDRSAGPSPVSTRHLPRTQSFSRSQPDFYPSSGVDDDSSSFESESERSRSRGGASTSDADSLAFAPASSRGPSQGSDRFESAGEARRDHDRFSLSSENSPPHGRLGSTGSSLPPPRESPSSSFADFAPEPKRGSRTMVSSRPLQSHVAALPAWRAEDDATFSTRRDPAPHDGDRRFDAAMSSSSSDLPRPRSFADRQHDYGIDSQSRTSYSDRPAPDAKRDRDPQRTFDSMLQKGIESGSVQRFGKHGAPVSRRTARRLGLQ